jgi:membrane glycosyltransferase
MDKMRVDEREEATGQAWYGTQAIGEEPLLPRPSPLPMPVQPLNRRTASSVTRDRLSWPRAALLAMTLSATAIFTCVLYQVLSVVHMTALQGVFLVLCTLCFAWIALGTSSAVIGFCAALPRPARTEEEGSVGRPGGRTALLFPVYHEDPARIAATIEAIANELIALGAGRSFDAFVLSDSRSQSVRVRELAAVRLLRGRLGGRLQVYYRARAHNIGKKAGNIADWVESFGGAYETFIILDADSIMSGALMVRLASIMAERPRTALIQTVPRLVGARTFFARLQQFAVAFYGPVIAAGFAAWHRESGNYWGHNAIIRTRAFAHAAGLPRLPGRPPLGGHIQSHDFVEAAYLRRAGWEVWMLPQLEGSYEGCPPTLIDLAVRDRRWAQGNLQHLRVIGAAGLPWVSRMHLAMGTYAYFASAFWALSLIVGVALSIQSAYTLPVYFPDERTLFPIWPVIDPTKALYLLIATVSVVLLPKVLGILYAFLRADPATRRPGWFLLGAGLETLFSVLIAPILMLTQTRAVLEVLLGKDAGWLPQRREGGLYPLGEILRFHRSHVLIGAGLAFFCGLVSAYVLAWMLPIIVGLLLAVDLSRLTSQPPPSWITRALATPEELQPPSIVAAVWENFGDWRRRLTTGKAEELVTPAA